MFKVKPSQIYILIIAIITIGNACTSRDSLNVTQWRGPDRTGIYNEPELMQEWPEEGPELLWSYDSLPSGYASMSVFDSIVYTTGKEDSMDVVLAINPDGTLKFQTPFGRAWHQSFPDSRCTPTINNGKLYVISGGGDIACLNQEDGQIIWKINGYEEFESKTGIWGFSESPLIVDDKVIFTAAGDRTTIVALNKETGETIWESESLNDTTAYASPILINENGKDIIINVLANYLLGVEASNGDILFKINYAEISNDSSVAYWSGGPYTNTNTPIYKHKQIYVTSGYNHVGVKFQLSNDLTEIKVAWIDTALDVHHGGAVLVDGYIYGSNWVTNRTGNWCCLNWDTGEIMWETTWQGKGSIIANNDMLYLYEEWKGHAGLAKASPDSFHIISSFQVELNKGWHWAHPVISNGILYLRNTKALMAYNIKEKLINN